MTFWTATRISDMERLWHEGHSLSHIASVIGGTRNQVIGKISRLGINAQPRTPLWRETWPQERLDEMNLMLWRGASIKAIADTFGVQHETVKRRALAQGWTLGRGRTPHYTPPPDYTPPLRPVPPNQTGCEYIFNDPRDGADYCGKAKRPGKPYCDVHCRACYLPLPPRNKRPLITAADKLFGRVIG